MFLSIETMEKAASASLSSALLSGQSDGLLTQVLEQTNALRGYVIKGDPKFLATYRDSTAAFDKALAGMDAQADAPDLKARIGKMREAMADWRERIGDKVVSLMADPATHGEAADLSGAKGLNAIRAIQKEIGDAALQTATADQAERARAVRVAYLWMTLGGLSGLAAAALMGWLLSKSIADPVSQMTAAMRRLASGDHGVEPPAKGRRTATNWATWPRRSPTSAMRRSRSCGWKPRPSRSGARPRPSARPMRSARARRRRSSARW